MYIYINLDNRSNGMHLRHLHCFQELQNDNIFLNFVKIVIKKSYLENKTTCTKEK